MESRSSFLAKKRFNPGKHYKTLKHIEVEVKKESIRLLYLGIYPPPRATSGDYRLLLENELSEVCNWASL